MDFLFDIGNVILKFDFAPAIEKLREKNPPSGQQPLGRIEELKLEHESGAVDDDTFIERAIEISGFIGTREDFVKIWVDIFDPNQPIIDLVGKLTSQDGHRLYLFSNTNGLHLDH
ncbi:MAG: HAD family phosphatase, partial [Verrucomicrobiales bacterium]